MIYQRIAELFNKTLVDCETCNGQGKGYFSCCTGDILKGLEADYGMCPECREHLGEDMCGDCFGIGKVEL